MRRVLAWLLFAACGSDPRRVEIRLITPVEEDPIATADQYVVSADHPQLGGSQRTFAADDAPFELPSIDPGQGWVFSVEGRLLGAPWALGRSCPTDIPAEGDLPSPTVYFSLLRQFSTVGAMGAGRLWPSVLPLEEGGALVLGGDPAAAPLRYALDHAGFDPASGPVMDIVQSAPLDDGFLAVDESGDAWRVTSAGEVLGFSAPGVARSGARLTPMGDGFLLFSGGQVGDAVPLPDATWVFDLSRGAFEPGPRATGRRDHSASDVGRGNVLLLGGRSGSGAVDVLMVSTAEVIAAGRRFAMTELAIPRWQHTATILADGEGVLVVGGRGAAGLAVADVEIYDPTSVGATTLLAPADGLAHARAGHTATPIAEGRFVLIAGGWGEDETPVATAELYDVARRQFRPTDDLRAPRAGHAALTLCDGTVLLVGGEGDGAGAAEIYNPDPGL